MHTHMLRSTTEGCLHLPVHDKVQLHPSRVLPSFLHPFYLLPLPLISRLIIHPPAIPSFNSPSSTLPLPILPPPTFPINIPLPILLPSTFLYLSYLHPPVEGHGRMDRPTRPLQRRCDLRTSLQRSRMETQTTKRFNSTFTKLPCALPSLLALHSSLSLFYSFLLPFCCLKFLPPFSSSFSTPHHPPLLLTMPPFPLLSPHLIPPSSCPSFPSPPSP